MKFWTEELVKFDYKSEFSSSFSRSLILEI